uniref:Proline-rich receptor-like protein kinase PERK14 n=1 Tax=Nicotiana tabacum TaxID=4097 RepID=A0A1S3YZC0_TOBAC|nr:PREDICTED: proline-rich receptor-like protein kinase PERK14 [Nicotiana tabacum]XP_016457463.1 PREDICTED: proline-rich receptor-like protein kinase PERK14 [Nicotiana tabacum]
MENWSSGNMPIMQHPETKHEDRKPLMEVKTTGLYPSSSSPSSPSSSEDSILELSTSRKDPLGDLYTKSEKDSSLSPSPASSSSPDVPSQTPQWSMISASPRGEMEAPPFPDEWNGANPSPMKSPPIHTMGHPPGYDPNRIPSSVFSSKPTNPMEWSTASNESLFSIHMGNNSFSRDQFNMMYRSGELTKPEEWSNSPANPYNAQPEVKSNEKKSLPPNLPLPLVEMATDREVKSASVVEGPAMQEKIVESPKIVPVENHENNIKDKTSNVDDVQHSASAPNKSDDKAVPPTEASHASSPRLSNESGNSSSSFAFPVLLNDAGKTGSLKAASAKMERHQPQPQPDSQPAVQPQSPPRSRPQPQQQSKQPESQPKLAATTWFSCFSCWPRCC